MADVRSVTQILKAIGYTRSYGQVDEHIREQAMARGRAVHLACQLYDENDLDEDTVDPRIFGYLKAWKDLLEAFPDSQSICWEHELTHPQFGYIMHIDNVRWFNKQRALFDLKTGESIDPATTMQVAAYRNGWDARYPNKLIRIAGAIRLSSKGIYRIHLYSELELLEAWQDFVAATRVLRRREELHGVRAKMITKEDEA